MKYIDGFLNNITMYRLVLYYLAGLLGIAAVLTLFGFLSFGFWALIISTVFILAVSLVVNDVFARTFDAHVNTESVYISALILALIITPAKSLHELIFLGWAATLAMASKYILAIRKKHVFNPVAVAVFLTSIAINGSASWWVGTGVMMPFVAIGGFLIIRKIRRFDMVGSFLGVGLTTIVALSILSGVPALTAFSKAIIDSPILFFAAIMLTEPLTTPPTSDLRSLYGAIVGFLFSPQVHFGPVYLTPESALLIGNIYSYIASPQERFLPVLKRKIRLSPDIYDFVFSTDRKPAFVAGQYMEWTLPHTQPDTRGNRRYFTLASSPMDEELRIGVRFHPEASTFKRTMLDMIPGSRISVSQVAGDFSLPKNAKEKLVFIAGGIGITPFRSMIRYLMHTGEHRDIVLFYAAANIEEFVYTDTFRKAEEIVGLKTVYTITRAGNAPPDWHGYTGYVSADMIRLEVPDWSERTFYLSGPDAMVRSYTRMLKQMGVSSSRIVTDYFPGF